MLGMEIKKLVVAALLTFALLLCSQKMQAQNTGQLLLPFSTLASAGSTNLANGWSSVTAYTNVTGGWNSSSNATILVTNIIYTTNTSYADISCANQKDLGLFFAHSSGVGTNVYTFGRYMDSGAVETNSTATVAVGKSSAGRVTYGTNFPAAWIGSWNGIRLLNVAWTDLSSTGWTNDSKNLTYGIKKP